MQQRCLPNALAIGLVQGLYSFAPLSLCPAALILLDSVGFLWCWACVKIQLLLTAGHVSKSVKERESPVHAISRALVRAVTSSWLFETGEGHVCWAGRQPGLSAIQVTTVICELRPPSESEGWCWARLCGSYRLLMTNFVSCSNFLRMWSHIQCCYKSAKGCSISTRLLWGAGAWRSLAQD